MNKKCVGIFWSVIFYIWSPHVLGQNGIISRDSLRHVVLNEVIVYALQPNGPGSRSVIGQDAIRHIQATDLSGLSQLLPGVLVRNPNLNVPGIFMIRGVTHDNETNARGTAILVDGLRVSNNTNMQQVGLGRYGNLYNSSAFAGADVRFLAPTSVESVEVIRGVPSARYGDVTSGVVLVKSKVGWCPITVGLRFTATEKLASIGKGFHVGRDKDVLFLGADYAYSQPSPLVVEEAFRRVGIQAAYAKDFNSGVLHLHFRGYWAQDYDRRGRNTIDGEYRKMLNRGFSFSINGQVDFEKWWISSLEYQTGVTYGQQRNESSSYYSGTRQVTTCTTQAGEHEGIFLSPNYFARLVVDGKPIRTDVSLIANLNKSFHDKLVNRLQVGINVAMEGNDGEGVSFDPRTPPLEMLGIRTRSYRDAPFLYQYGVFAENLVTLYSGEKRTELQVGTRVTRSKEGAVHHRPVIDPRVNVRQVLVERDKRYLLNQFSIRVGWGVLHKMPVLAYACPEKSYTDVNGFTYNDEENGHQLAVVHTFISDGTFNSRLRLPVNRKVEIGVGIRVKDVVADIVWFDEYLKYGYCTANQAEPFTYRRYDPLVDQGKSPVLTGAGVENDHVLLPYTTNATFAVYSRPENGIEQKKWGVEYAVGPIRWERLRSSLFVNGSYIKVKEKNMALSALHPALEVGGRAYPYVGIYEATTLASNLQMHQLFSTRFQWITQVPAVRLVASLALQCVWLDKRCKGMESRYENPVYLTDGQGIRVEGNPMTDTKHEKRINPVFYMDREGVQHPFTRDMETDDRYSDLVLRAGTLTAYQSDAFHPYFLLNLRINKDIGKHVSVAFCGNNLLQWNPKRLRASTGQYVILNPELYYGAELSIRF